MPKKTGFTLIELLVVISIIGVLSSVVFASVQEGRRKAKNTAINVQVEQYIKAMELYHSERGDYYPTSPSDPLCPGGCVFVDICLGHVPPNESKCYVYDIAGLNIDVVEDPGFISQMEKYIHGAPNPNRDRVESYSASYICADFPIDGICDTDIYNIKWFLHGNDARCGIGEKILTNLSGVGPDPGPNHTICSYSPE